MLNQNSPSQNRVFSEKRPFTREFGKEGELVVDLIR